jgi:negative regulator of flagellin synthesis FlgM
LNISNDVSQARIAETRIAETSVASTPGATPTSAASATAAASTAGGSAASAGVQASDQATISSTSGLLASALSVNDTRLEKVVPVKAAIDAGTYSVPSSLVADKVISALTM